MEKLKFRLFDIGNFIIIFLFFLACQHDSINDALLNADKITAADQLSEIELLASSYSPELKLISITSNVVNYNGYAPEWHYLFQSGETTNYYYLHATATNTVFDSASAIQILGSTFINHPWFNSNKAIQIAEKNGGNDFRKNNPEYSIEASIGEPLVSNSTTIWDITYRSNSDDSISLTFLIDANSGKITLKYP